MSTSNNNNNNANNSNTRQIPLVCPGHTRPLAELQFLSPPNEPHRTFLVSACHDKMPMIRDAVSGDWIGTWAGHKGAVWSTKLDPQGYLAATASGDFTVKVWDAVTGKELFTFPHGHIVKTVDFSKDSKRLATGGHEGILRVFDLEKGAKATETVMEFPLHRRQGGAAEGGQKVNITKCLWLDETLVMAAGSDGKISVWNTAATADTTACVCTLQVPAEVRDMEITEFQNDKTILTVASGETVSFFQVERGTDRMLLKGTLVRQHKMPIHFREEGGASLHPEKGDRFVAGGSDLWVRVFDFDSGKELECHRGHHGPIRCVRYSPDGKTYATGSEDGTIRIWKTDPRIL
jgi:FOG: WD40 repeat